MLQIPSITLNMHYVNIYTYVYTSEWLILVESFTADEDIYIVSKYTAKPTILFNYLKYRF